MYWMDFYNEIFCCGFLCARLISVSLSGSLFRLPRRGLPRPTALFSGYHAEGYNARTDAFKLTGYHVCRVTTPELPRSIQTSGYRRVITPAGSFKLISLSSANMSVLHNNHNFSTESGAHRTDPHKISSTKRNSRRSTF